MSQWRRVVPSLAQQPGRAVRPRRAASAIKGLQRVAGAAKTYRAEGNAALQKDWEEF